MKTKRGQVRMKQSVGVPAVFDGIKERAEEKRPWACALVLLNGKNKNPKYDLELYFMDAINECEAIGRAVIELSRRSEFRPVQCYLAKRLPE